MSLISRDEIEDKSNSAHRSEGKQWYSSCSEEDVWHAVSEGFLIPLRLRLHGEPVLCFIGEDAAAMLLLLRALWLSLACSLSPCALRTI
jgi:hypothetical protein